MLRYFSSIAVNLETIQINYLIPVHRFMPVDSMHATMERAVKNYRVGTISMANYRRIGT